MSHLVMNHLSGVIALLAVLTAGLAHGESPYRSSRTYGVDHGPPSYDYRDNHPHHDRYRSDYRDERRPEYNSSWRAPRVTPHSTVIAPQRKDVTPLFK